MVKYLYIRKQDGTLKYPDAKSEPLLSPAICNVAVPEDYVLEGEDIIFTLKKTDEIIQLSDCLITVGTSPEQVVINKQNQEIKKQLAELDKLVPRALEDVISETGLKLNDSVNKIIAQKKDLRCQLK